MTGHSLAVTSVDWKADLFVSCSDDKTVRIYKVKQDPEGIEFGLQKVINT
jgi:WD40 repeat protein